MRRFQGLPWLTALALTAMGLCSTNSFAQQPATVPRLAVATPNPTMAAPVTRQSDPMLEQLDQAIEVTSQRFLTADGPKANSPWQIFHGILALKRDFQLKFNGEKFNAIQWIATSEPRFDDLILWLGGD